MLFIDRKTKLSVDVSPKLAQAYTILRQRNKYLNLVDKDWTMPESMAYELMRCLGYTYTDRWKIQ